MMKLAEALINRSNIQKRIEILKEKLIKYAKVQEGEKPLEDPEELLIRLKKNYDDLVVYVQRINRSNAKIMFNDEHSFADVLAYRDMLVQKYNALMKIINSAADISSRYSRNEIKILSAINVRDYQNEADSIAKEYRELDLKIQEKNWQVELL